MKEDEIRQRRNGKRQAKRGISDQQQRENRASISLSV